MKAKTIEVILNDEKLGAVWSYEAEIIKDTFDHVSGILDEIEIIDQENFDDGILGELIINVESVSLWQAIRTLANYFVDCD